MKHIQSYKKIEIINAVLNKIPEKGKLLYGTYYGAHLFGLETENSDYDFKFLFIPNEFDINDRTPSHINLSTNKSKEANSIDDIDIEVISIYKYFNMLLKGDTNALDILFSMFREDTIIYKSSDIDKFFKPYYTDFLSKNLKNFLAYSASQAKKYGVKGERYSELTTIHNMLQKNINKETDKIKDFILNINSENFKYIELINKDNMIYIKILDKLYSETLTFKYFKERIVERFNSYGKRSEASASGTDFKALSHSYRIITELEELINTGFIKFPLQNREILLNIKKGNINNVSEIYDIIQNKLSYVEQSLDDLIWRKDINGMFLQNIILGIMSNTDYSMEM